MAIIGGLRQPDADYTVVDSVSGPVTAAFPIPQMALGFAVDVYLGDDYDPAHGLVAPYYLVNALHPGGSHLEPTLGQIWPRIG